MTPIYQSLVIAYAKAISKDGTRRFRRLVKSTCYMSKITTERTIRTRILFAR